MKIESRAVYEMMMGERDTTQKPPFYSAGKVTVFLPYYSCTVPLLSLQKSARARNKWVVERSPQVVNKRGPEREV